MCIERKVAKDRSSLRNFIDRCATALCRALLLPLHRQCLRLHHRRIATQQLPCCQCHCLQQRAHAATAKDGTARGVGRRNKLPREGAVAAGAGATTTNTKTLKRASSRLEKQRRTRARGGGEGRGILRQMEQCTKQGGRQRGFARVYLRSIGRQQTLVWSCQVAQAAGSIKPRHTIATTLPRRTHQSRHEQRGGRRCQRQCLTIATAAGCIAADAA